MAICYEQCQNHICFDGEINIYMYGIFYLSIKIKTKCK